MSYADEFLIFSRGHAVEAWNWAPTTLERIGLTLSYGKLADANGVIDDHRPP